MRCFGVHFGYGTIMCLCGSYVSVMGDRVTIKIPRELYVTLEGMIHTTGFASVTEFIVFVMRTLASSDDPGNGDHLSDDEVRAVRERLKKLGYI